MTRTTLAFWALWSAACTPPPSPGATPVVIVGGRDEPVISRSRAPSTEPPRAKEGAGATLGRRIPPLTTEKVARSYPGLISLSGSYRLKRDDVLRTSPRRESRAQARLSQGSLVQAQGVLAGWLLVTAELDGRSIAGWIPLPATQADAAER